MNPRRFLTIVGPVLIAMGILGLTGILGSISSASFFHPPSWINWVHLFLGAVVLTIAFTDQKRLHILLTGFAMILGLTLGLVGLLFGSSLAMRFAIPELADPSDHIAHSIVGVLALWAFLHRKK